jgi:hypothetical protein
MATNNFLERQSNFSARNQYLQYHHHVNDYPQFNNRLLHQTIHSMNCTYPFREPSQSVAETFFQSQNCQLSPLNGFHFERPHNHSVEEGNQHHDWNPRVSFQTHSTSFPSCSSSSLSCSTATSAVANIDYGYCVTKISSADASDAESAMKSRGGRKPPSNLPKQNISSSSSKKKRKHPTQTGNKRRPPHEYQVSVEGQGNHGSNFFPASNLSSYSSTSEQSAVERTEHSKSGTTQFNLTHANRKNDEVVSDPSNQSQTSKEKNLQREGQDFSENSMEGDTSNNSPNEGQNQNNDRTKSTPNRRRIRHNFTPNQSKCLEEVFDSVTHYPDFGLLLQHSKKLRLPVERIQVWFQNRRAKFRRNSMLHLN